MDDVKSYELSSIDEIITAAKNGEIFILVDDEDRENEGDVCVLAEHATPESINFMAKYARGLICLALERDRVEKLGLSLMQKRHESRHETAFTLSIEAREGVTTGISAHDRSRTIMVASNPQFDANHITTPGHIFPLIAKEGGVLRRTGHTEAAIDFARLAGFQPAGVIVEIMNEDGTMARLPQLVEVAKQFNLKLVSIEDLVAYRMEHDSLIEKKEDFELETRFGRFRLRAYLQTTNNQVHIALTKGSWGPSTEVPVRVNASMVNNDLLASLTQDTHQTLDAMFQVINDRGLGAMVFINQNNPSLNVLGRLTQLKSLQVEGTIVKAPQLPMDNKDFGIGAQILHDLGIHKIKLISNHEQSKRVGMIGYGLEITDYISY